MFDAIGPLGTSASLFDLTALHSTRIRSELKTLIIITKCTRSARTMTAGSESAQHIHIGAGTAQALCNRGPYLWLVGVLFGEWLRPAAEGELRVVVAGDLAIIAGVPEGKVRGGGAVRPNRLAPHVM